MIPFSANVSCINVAVTTTASASVALPAANRNVRLVNEGPSHCYISIGIGAQTATLPGSTPARTATPILAGTDIVLGIPDSTNIQQISAICRTGTATLNIQLDGGM